MEKRNEKSKSERKKRYLFPQEAIEARGSVIEYTEYRVVTVTCRARVPFSMSESNGFH